MCVPPPKPHCLLNINLPSLDSLYLKVLRPTMQNKQLERELRSIVQNLKGNEILRVIEVMEREEGLVFLKEWTSKIVAMVRIWAQLHLLHPPTGTGAHHWLREESAGSARQCSQELCVDPDSNKFPGVPSDPGPQMPSVSTPPTEGPPVPLPKGHNSSPVALPFRHFCN